MYGKAIKIDDVDKEILMLLLQGKTSRQIGKAVYKSPRTIEQRIVKLRQYYRADNLKHLISIITGASVSVDKVDNIASKKAQNLIDFFGNERAVQVVDFLLQESHEQVGFWLQVKSIMHDKMADTNIEG